MKFIPALTITLVLSVMSLKSYGSYQLKYRIQIAISSEKKVPQKFKAIPELKTFTLPTGAKIYFSGGYFNNYKNAKNKLEEVHKVGFNKAFIRVFKYNSLLSKSVGDFYIEKVKNKISSNQRDNNNSKIKSNNLAFEDDKKVYSRAEFLSLKKKIEKTRRIKEKELVSNSTLSKEKEFLEEFSINTIVTEPPVFKIFVGKQDNKVGKLNNFKQLKNEIIYTYKGRNETKYAVGFYQNEEEAKKNLPKYKKLINDAEIVGFYKGMIISLKLANELLVQYYKNNITK